MFRKILFVAFFLSACISASAQLSVGGKVEMKKSETETVPVEGAKVDCYRIDINQGCRSTNTNSHGEFLILGIPPTAQVVIAVSGEGISPRISPTVRAGTEDMVIEVFEGDGKVLTEAEVRDIIAKAPTITGELTEEQKKEQAELEKKIKEIEAKNAQAQNKNELYDKFTKEGNDAFQKKDYVTAAAKFEEGYKVDPQYLGSAPFFLNKKAESLLNDAIEIYNTAVKSGDKAAISKAKDQASKNFEEALTTINKSYQLTTKASPADIPNADSHKKNIKASESVAKSIVSTMGKMNVSLAANIASEKDAEDAVKIYKDTLAMIPGDPDVMAGLALSLYMSGEFLGSKEKKQESLNYWTEYKKVAPKDHSQQAAADEFIEILTSIDKLKAQKID